MSINSLETAVKYSQELDKLFAQKSVTGFFADNSFGKKFVGAKTVIIPDIDFQGLADYDRDLGFSRSAITVSNTPYTMTMDRARSLQIDREDMDETGIASLAGKVLGEYVRTKVVPECDAYVLSKLSQVAISRGNTLPLTTENPYETLVNLINNVRNIVGFDEELVAFVNSNVYAVLQNSPEVTRMLIPSNFKQGDLNFAVNSINGTAIIPVVNALMKTEYNFEDNEAGGFTPSGNTDAWIIVCPKKAAHLVKKTENMRIFTPEQNLDADAYKFDYRIYYDAFVKKSELDTIWACISPEVSVQLEKSEYSPTFGTGYSLLTEISTNQAQNPTLKYQWYYTENENLSGLIKIECATNRDFESTIMGENDLRDYYLILRVYVNGLSYVDSQPCHIICR